MPKWELFEEKKQKPGCTSPPYLVCGIREEGTRKVLIELAFVVRKPLEDLVEDHNAAMEELEVFRRADREELFDLALRG